jgi:hypothetical protein
MNDDPDDLAGRYYLDLAAAFVPRPCSASASTPACASTGSSAPPCCRASSASSASCAPWPPPTCSTSAAAAPSRPDDNPEHLHLFDRHALTELFARAGAGRLRVDFVLNHLVALALR